MQVRGCYFGKWGPSLLDQGRFFFLATPCSMRDLSSLSVCERAKSLQSCLTLCDPMDCSLPNSSVCGILQARILEWVACPPPGDLPDPAIEPACLLSPALAGTFFTTSTTWEAPVLLLLLLLSRFSRVRLCVTP